MDEYRATIADPELQRRFPQLALLESDVAFERLLYVSDFSRRVTTRFSFPRDPRDAHFIELAITGAATHIITVDNDLLDLPTGRTEAARRFRQRLPRIEVLNPRVFVSRYGQRLEMI